MSKAKELLNLVEQILNPPKELRVLVDREVYQSLTGNTPSQAKELMVKIHSERKMPGGFEYMIISHAGKYAAISADTRYEGVYGFSPLEQFPEIKELGLTKDDFVAEWE
jgi:hypothetical protein